MTLVHSRCYEIGIRQWGAPGAPFLLIALLGGITEALCRMLPPLVPASPATSSARPLRVLIDGDEGSDEDDSSPSGTPMISASPLPQQQPGVSVTVSQDPLPRSRLNGADKGSPRRLPSFYSGRFS